MSNIRDILQALNEQDRRLFLKTRAAMRREYIRATIELVGADAYAETDDLFLDVIDNRVCELFKRAGRDIPSQNFAGAPSIKRPDAPNLSDAQIAELETGIADELSRERSQQGA